jgi:hypothetical protein
MIESHANPAPGQNQAYSVIFGKEGAFGEIHSTHDSCFCSLLLFLFFAMAALQ